MMLPGTLSSTEMLQRPAPAHGRPRERRIAFALHGSPGDVLARTPVLAHLHHVDHTQGTVSVPVATSVEAMPYHLSGGGFCGRRSTEAGEGSLAPQPCQSLSEPRGRAAHSQRSA